MKTANQELEQLKQELNQLEAKKTCTIKGGCCGPGKNGNHSGNGNGNGNGNRNGNGNGGG